MIYVVPSRGRPDNVNRLINAFRDTRSKTFLHVALDTDDPELAGYRDMLTRQGHIPWLRVSVRKRRSTADGMVSVLNLVACDLAKYSHSAIGFMGDDHVPVTPNWDSQLEQEIAVNRNLVVYGNDLLQGANLPTAVLLDSRVIRALGYMAPPTFQHLYVDNVWLLWGRRLNAISYRGDVIIEHMHPVLYKAPTDTRYEAVNSSAMWSRDEAAYHRYLADDLDLDLAKIRKVVESDSSAS